MLHIDMTDMTFILKSFYEKWENNLTENVNNFTSFKFKSLKNKNYFGRN